MASSHSKPGTIESLEVRSLADRVGISITARSAKEFFAAAALAS